MASKSAAATDIPSERLETFDSLIGHERVTDYIRKAFARGRLPQALMFDGPPGVGKSAMAFALAKFLLAGGEESGPEFERVRAKIETEPIAHPDLRLLTPTGAAGQIRVETVREAHDTAFHMPIESPRKVFIIDPADRLNPSSGNSLLKLFEEPPKALTIILCVESAHSVLPTIRSRASRVRLLSVDEKRIADWLIQRHGASQEEAGAAALFSGGSPGQAIGLLGGRTLADRDKLVEEWQFFQRHGFLALFRVSHNLSGLGGSLEALTNAWIVWIRDAYTAAIAPERPDLLVNRDRANDLTGDARRYGAQALGACLGILLEARSDARRLVNKQLYVENLLLRLGKALKGRG